jgi:hypothetical protein
MSASTRQAKRKQMENIEATTSENSEHDEPHRTRETSIASSIIDSDFENELQSKCLKFASELEKFTKLSVLIHFRHLSSYLNILNILKQFKRKTVDQRPFFSKRKL